MASFVPDISSLSLLLLPILSGLFFVQKASTISLINVIRTNDQEINRVEYSLSLCFCFVGGMSSFYSGRNVWIEKTCDWEWKSGRLNYRDGLLFPSGFGQFPRDQIKSRSGSSPLAAQSLEKGIWRRTKMKRTKTGLVRLIEVNNRGLVMCQLVVPSYTGVWLASIHGRVLAFESCWLGK